MEKTIKHSGTSGQGQSEAERRVKVAAPEMLAALEQLLDLTALMPNSDDAFHDPELEPALERARAAIAKAKGG
jgi:hypothetical protein